MSGGTFDQILSALASALGSGLVERQAPAVIVLRSFVGVKEAWGRVLKQNKIICRRIMSGVVAVLCANECPSERMHAAAITLMLSEEQVVCNGSSSSFLPSVHVFTWPTTTIGLDRALELCAPWLPGSGFTPHQRNVSIRGPLLLCRWGSPSWTIRRDETSITCSSRWLRWSSLGIPRRSRWRQGPSTTYATVLLLHGHAAWMRCSSRLSMAYSSRTSLRRWTLPSWSRHRCCILSHPRMVELL